jgi:hypothetical protein
MRAFLFLFAVAVLFMSGPERAYAHSNHHAHQHHARVTAAVEVALPTHADVPVFSQLLSASEDAQKCPHGKKRADCSFCCVCVVGSAAVLAPSALQSWQRSERSEYADLSVSFEVRQPVLDLSRPPKSFA